MKYDVVVILSHQSFDGINSSEYEKRLNHGLNIFKNNDCKFIMLCSETANQKNLQYLIDNGVDEKSIILQKYSRDTITEAYYSKKMIPENCKNILIISSDYHINYRVSLIFDYVFNCEYDVKYENVYTGKMGKKEVILNQSKSLKLFLKNFLLEEPIENQIKKHKLYKEIIWIY